MNRSAPTRIPVQSARPAPVLPSVSRRRMVGAAAGSLGGLALASRAALANQVGAEPGAEPLADLSLSYSDVHGPGQLMVTPLGADTATGGTAVSVHLAQARGPFAGAGFVRPVGDESYVLAASVAGVAGIPGGSRESYFLAGTLRREDSGWRGQGRWSAVADPSLSGEWHVAEWPAIQPPRPQLTASVLLESVAGSGVRGAATLVQLPDGETRFELQLQGLTAGISYALQLRAGTPVQPSASFTQLDTFATDAAGRLTTQGLVRFRGTEPIALLDIAGGDHFLSIVALTSEQTVAAGAIPALQPLG
jgi:hypothetical protein